MLLRLEIDDETEEIYADIIDADASAGIVLPYGTTDSEIIEFCNEQLAAPNEIGNYDYYTIIRE